MSSGAGAGGGDDRGATGTRGEIMELDYRVIGAMALFGFVALLLLVAVGYLADMVQARMAARLSAAARASAWWRRGALLGALALIIVVAHIYASRILPHEVHRAREAVELIDVEKWVDGISMFEDKVRIRFRYRNRTDRDIESFTAHFMLDEGMMRIINDHLTITAPLASGHHSSWTEAYWTTCPQGFSAEAWEKLLRRDIHDFEVRFVTTSVAFADGEIIN
jgi:hypothetical protein